MPVNTRQGLKAVAWTWFQNRVFPRLFGGVVPRCKAGCEIAFDREVWAG